MEDLAKKIVKKKIITIILGSLAGIAPFLIGIFTLFIAAFVVLGLLEIDANASSNGNTSYVTEECGFTISRTSLSKSEYKKKIEEFAKENSNFKIFADNANEIYKYAESKKINPELVVIRAYVEGGGTTTGTNNYWGMGCFNGQGIDACFDYATFEEGYIDYINNISQYNSLADMMSKYAYIGKFWYNPGNSSDGGCYYAKYIYAESNMPSRVSKACSASAPLCSTSDTTYCTATTDDDQKAYATWQIERNMAPVREMIFGLKFNEGICTYNYGSIQHLSAYTLNGNGLNVLNRTLSSTEQTQLSNYINTEINKAGFGTGAGVAAAGQALAYWLEQKGYYLQYYWGGGHYSAPDDEGRFIGVNPNWGSSEYGCDHYGRCYWGMDCSGFVSWAIRIGCTTSYYIRGAGSMEHGPEIDISQAKPGDLMVKHDGEHVRMIIKNNGDGSVITLEETGRGYDGGGLWFTKQSASNDYKIIDMSEYYKTTCDAPNLS